MSRLNATTLKLDHTHCRAICDEIGERLGQILKPVTSEIPPHLAALLDRFKQLEIDSTPFFESAPSIVPSIEEPLLPRRFLTFWKN
jgi:hypothetical protein